MLLRIDTGEMYTVNDTTLSFLQELDGERSVADIAGRMVDAFDVEPAIVLADLIEVANGLAAESLVVIAQ
ncbi:PqqD family protein [Mesorhizobium sp. KR2-14]|uniref:PqqD family protein n=1 Tax=Mesorhizobium sp. KR2-14 TaxID=3156610 RepID=UPI0032B3B6A2